jgi:hypothetical protein
MGFYTNHTHADFSKIDNTTAYITVDTDTFTFILVNLGGVYATQTQSFKDEP